MAVCAFGGCLELLTVMPQPAIFGQGCPKKARQRTDALTGRLRACRQPGP